MNLSLMTFNPKGFRHYSERTLNEVLYLVIVVSENSSFFHRQFAESVNLFENSFFFEGNL